MDPDLLLTVVVTAAAFIALESERNRQHNLRYIEHLRHQNAAYFFNHCGMRKPVFNALLKKLTSVMGGLSGSRKIGAGMKLMIFLSILRGHSYRAIATMWQHGYRQISQSMHQVIDSILRCQADIWQSTGEPILSDRIRMNAHYFPYFEHCLGALDGTHVMAKVPPELQQRFRGRKGITQNVLGVCNFDMNFVMALAGWEGSAHDARVLNDAVQVRKLLPLFDSWYYLGDARYGLTPWCLTPYCGVRYNLREWDSAALANILPVNAKELFNMRHSALRNVIDRTYGSVKARFPILRVMPHGYSIPTQCNLVLTSFLIHNFIRLNQDEEDDFRDIDEVDDGEERHAVGVEFELEDDHNVAQAWRQGIADAMWADWLIAHPPI